MAGMTDSSNNPFNPELWRPVDVPGVDSFTDITYHHHVGEGRANGIVRIAFDRPEVRNAFRPHTVDELYRALDHARRTPDVGTILLTGNGPSRRTAAGRFAPAATSASAAVPVISTPPATIRTSPPLAQKEWTRLVRRWRAAACTSWRCSA